MKFHMKRKMNESEQVSGALLDVRRTNTGKDL